MRFAVYALTHWWPLRLLGYGDTLYVIGTRVTASGQGKQLTIRWLSLLNFIL